MTLESKNSSYGYVEIRELEIGFFDTKQWYGLYVNGELKEQSVDLSYIQNRYDRL